MRDVAFLVRLPEGATGTQRSRRLLEGLLPEDGIRSQKKRTGKRYPASCRATCVVKGTAAVVWRAKEVSSLSGRSSKSEA